ncbi:MAG TPA: single-stranded DNA-binding protein [Nevskiaceae bacterium]|nr:single-stranded DNA-binding protein [Nevskiaceae bacterium]
MRGVNKVTIIGRLGADPKTKAFDNGGCIANLSIATTEAWKDKQSGELRELTEWHRVVCSNRLAEIADQYLRKGSTVYVSGSLRTRKYQASDGTDRYATEIRARELQMLDRKPDDETPASTRSRPSSNAYASAKGKAPVKDCPQPDQGNGTDAFPDDIPF